MLNTHPMLNDLGSAGDQRRMGECQEQKVAALTSEALVGTRSDERSPHKRGACGDMHPYRGACGDTARNTGYIL